MSEQEGAPDVVPPPATVDFPPPLPPSGDDWRPPQPPRPRPELPILTLGELAWLITAAALTDIGLRTGLSTATSALAALIVAIVILGPRTRQNVVSTSFTLGAIVFALWLPLRASTWLTSLNAAAVAALLLCAAATARPLRLRLTTNTIAIVISRIFLSRLFLLVLALAAAPFRTTRASQAVPILRGVLIAILPVAVMATLLASADVVFAESITTDIDPSIWIGHVLLTVVAAAAIAGIVAIAGDQPDESFEERRPLGATEALVLLASLGGLYAAFTLVQLRSALGHNDQILQNQGVTYAEYARNGFFQLLWVAGLTIVLLGIVRLLVTNGRSALHSAVRVLGSIVALLTTLIVVAAIGRLGLYTDEFGQTTLRWYCTAFAWMLGVAFVAIAVGHWSRAERLLPVTLVGLVAVTLFTVNMVNPEARVAEHNLGRNDAAGSLDAEYLTRLSADAWPALLNRASLVSSRLPAGQTLQAHCDAADMPRGFGPFGFNLAVERLKCS